MGLEEEYHSLYQFNHIPYYRVNSISEPVSYYVAAHSPCDSSVTTLPCTFARNYLSSVQLVSDSRFRVYPIVFDDINSVEIYLAGSGILPYTGIYKLVAALLQCRFPTTESVRCEFSNEPYEFYICGTMLFDKRKTLLLSFDCDYIEGHIMCPCVYVNPRMKYICPQLYRYITRNISIFTTPFNAGQGTLYPRLNISTYTEYLGTMANSSMVVDASCSLDSFIKYIL